MSRNYYTIITHPENPTELATRIYLKGDDSWIEFRRFSEEGELGDAYHRAFNIEKLFELFEENEKLKKELDRRGELFNERNDKVLELCEKNERLSARISVLESRLADSSKLIKERESENERLSARIDYLENRLADYGKLIKERESENERLRNEVQVQYKCRLDLQKIINDFNTCDENKEITDLKRLLEDANNRICDQTKQIIQKDAHIAGLKCALGSKDAIIGMKDIRITKLEVDIKGVRQTLSERDAEIQILKNRVFEGDTVGYRRLKSENEKLKEAVALCDERVDELCQKIDRLNKTCADLTRERDVLKKSLAERDEQIGALKGEVEEYKARIKSWQEYINSIRSEVLDIRDVITKKFNLHPSVWSTGTYDKENIQLHEIQNKIYYLIDLPKKPSIDFGVVAIDFKKWNKLNKKLRKKEEDLEWFESEVERTKRQIKEIKDAMHKA